VEPLREQAPRNLNLDNPRDLPLSNLRLTRASLLTLTVVRNTPPPWAWLPLTALGFASTVERALLSWTETKPILSKEKKVP
jgi:hypothetical protein